MSQKIPFDKSKKINFFIISSQSPLTPFAPNYRYVIAESLLKDIDTNKIAKFILNLENTLLKNNDKIVSDGYTGLGLNSLTSRFNNYNLFDYCDEEIELLKLKNQIKDTYNDFLEQLNFKNFTERTAFFQCWANVMRKGEQIKPHLHDTGPHSYLSGHFCVQTEKTKTYYINPVNQINEPEIFESLNEPGKLTFFQNCLPHFTDTYDGDSERISIAFDISLDVENKSKLKSFRKF